MKMGKNFSESEKSILGLFAVGRRFNYDNKEYTVIRADKPTCDKGEPKTDIYVLAKSESEEAREFKISYKQDNADFLENKMSDKRAQQIFGDDWNDIIRNATNSIRNKFYSRKLIYKNKYRHTDKGAITLGWKFEFVNKSNGELSGDMQLTKNQIIDVYSGTNLPKNKRNAIVNGMEIENSGVANYMLFEDEKINRIQDAVDKMIPIVKYAEEHPKIYFACKALNYYSYKNKYDGNRPLAVFVDWEVKDNKLSHTLVFDAPLLNRGNSAYEKLMSALETMGVSTTDDLKSYNVTDDTIIYE